MSKLLERGEEVHISYIPSDPFSVFCKDCMYRSVIKDNVLKFTGVTDMGKIEILNYLVI